MENTNANQMGQIRNEKGQIIGGKPPAGFDKHPENRSNGRWRKEDSISEQYNMFLRMNAEEVRTWEENHLEKDRTMAQEIAYRAMLRARKSLKDLQEITDRTEGKAPQTLVHEGGFFSQNKLEFVEVKPIKMDDTTINTTEADIPTT